MPSGLSPFAEVAIPLAVHETFSYAIPESLRQEVRLGSRVEVPLGAKLTTGFVVDFADSTSLDAKRIRQIRSVLDEEEPALTPEIIALCRWAAEYYIAPLGEMLRVALPANMAARGRREAVFAGDDDLIAAAMAERRVLPGDLELLEAVRRRRLSLAQIFEEIKGARPALSRLRDAGLVTVGDRLEDARGVRYDRFVVLESSAESLPPKQQLVHDILAGRGGQMAIKALERAGASPASIETLTKKKIVRIERRPRRHTLDAFLAGLESQPAGEIRYSGEQLQAIETVRASLGRFGAFLIEGVTGSGKTEVYIELMREVVRRGKQALLLVPEISLTPVFASRLKERFGLDHATVEIERGECADVGDKA